MLTVIKIKGFDTYQQIRVILLLARLQHCTQLLLKLMWRWRPPSWNPLDVVSWSSPAQCHRWFMKTTVSSFLSLFFLDPCAVRGKGRVLSPAKEEAEEKKAEGLTAGGLVPSPISKFPSKGDLQIVFHHHLLQENTDTCALATYKSLHNFCFVCSVLFFLKSQYLNNFRIKCG